MMVAKTIDPLWDLAARVGVASSYEDAFGERQEIGRDRVAKILTLLGFDVSDDRAATASREKLSAAERTRILAPVLVIGDDVRPDIGLWVDVRLRDRLWRWTLTSENGVTRSEEFVPAEHVSHAEPIAPIGQHERVIYRLPKRLEHGYARLSVSCDDVRAEMTIIVVPAACYVPPKLGARGAWGLAVQLYGMRSKSNVGIGDFRDLGTLLETVAAAGGSAVGVNPLHELAHGGSLEPSPYSPTSRLFLNWLYLDIEALPGYDPDDADHAMIARLQAADLIDYPEVVAYKRRAARSAFDRFSATKPTDPEFAEFIKTGGDALRKTTIFAALADDRNANDPASGRWQKWPPEYRDPSSPQVAAFVRDHVADIAFYAYLQWQSDRQLATVARDGSLAIGLYRDLAVGADTGGADTWADQAVLRADVAIGAPPDILNRSGQNWGVAPFDPIALRAAAYAPFIALLRANMRHAGALRIDHVMLLARLWWVPRGVEPSDGAYVMYDLDELVGIIALESQRARCMVIGEDLGTVPAGFRERLAQAGILSYRLLQFETDDNGFVAPDRYPQGALVALATHDLPTIGAYWTGSDITLRRQVGSIPDDAAEQKARIERAGNREALLGAFTAADLGADAEHFRAVIDRPEDRQTLSEIALVANRYLAATPGRLLMVQLEDVLGEVNQANLPGTTDEHPNWRRRLPIDLTTIATDPRFLSLADALRAAGRAAT